MVGLWAFDEFFLQYPDPRHFLFVRVSTGHNQWRSSGSMADSSNTVVILMNDIGICMSDCYTVNVTPALFFGFQFWSFTLWPFFSHKVWSARVLFISTDQSLLTFVRCNSIDLVTATTQHYVNGCYSLLKVNTCAGWTVCNMMGEDVQVINSNEKLSLQYI